MSGLSTVAPLRFNDKCYRLVSVKQLVDVIFALGFQMFSPLAAEILIDFAQGLQHFHPNVNYKRKAATGVTNLICHRGCYSSFTFVYENTITLCVSKTVPWNGGVLSSLLNSFDMQSAASQITTLTNEPHNNVIFLIRVAVNPILKYRFPRGKLQKRMFCGTLRDYVFGVNMARYTCNDFYHVIAFDCCSLLDFPEAKFVQSDAQTPQKTTRLTPQDEAINNEYANPESPAANALFAGKLIIVAQQENSGVGLVKTDLLYPLMEKCLMSRPQPLQIEMPIIEYTSETNNYLWGSEVSLTKASPPTSIMQAYKDLGIIKPTTNTKLGAPLNDVQNFVKTTLNFDGDGFYRLPENTKPLQPTGILIDKAFLLIYIDEKNNPILAGLIN